MRNILLASALLIGFAGAASAQGVGGIVAGAAGFNQGGSSNSAFTFNNSGNATGSSASGFNATLGGANNATAAFSSNGTAFGNVTVTPTGMTNFSTHSGWASGSASQGASFSATAQTFAQNDGGVAFNTGFRQNSTGFENSFGVVGGAAVFAFPTLGFGHN